MPPFAMAGAVLDLCQIVYCVTSARAAKRARCGCLSWRMRGAADGDPSCQHPHMSGLGFGFRLRLPLARLKDGRNVAIDFTQPCFGQRLKAGVGFREKAEVLDPLFQFAVAHAPRLIVHIFGGAADLSGVTARILAAGPLCAKELSDPWTARSGPLAAGACAAYVCS